MPKKIRANATFDSARVAEIEKETRHDVVAFTRSVSESLGDEKKMGTLRLNFNGCCRYSERLFTQTSE